LCDTFLGGLCQDNELLPCSLLLLYLAHRQDKKKRALKKRKQSRKRKDFSLSLSIEERQQQYRKIPRCALIPLLLSPWEKLLKLQNDQAYITIMGFDCKFFDKILKKVGPMFSSHMPFNESGFIIPFEYVSGHKRNVLPEDCLGLVLVWMQTRGALNVFQLIFGLTYTNLSVYLRFGIRLLIETFHDDPLGKFVSPLQRKTTSTRPHLVNDIHCFMTVGQQWMD
jgi:hypothetical protein